MPTEAALKVRPSVLVLLFSFLQMKLSFLIFALLLNNEDMHRIHILKVLSHALLVD